MLKDLHAMLNVDFTFDRYLMIEIKWNYLDVFVV